MRRYALVGHFVEVYQPRIGESFVDDEHEEIVALFSSEQAAKEYERAARLKHRQRRSFASDKVYRSNSLLCDCESAHIEPYDPPEYPMDPTIPNL